MFWHDCSHFRLVYFILKKKLCSFIFHPKNEISDVLDFLHEHIQGSCLKSIKSEKKNWTKTGTKSARSEEFLKSLNKQGDQLWSVLSAEKCRLKGPLVQGVREKDKIPKLLLAALFSRKITTKRQLFYRNK